MITIITLKKGDCLELMKDIPDGSIDMILADLPYGTTACKWDEIIPFEPLWEQYDRIIKPKGIICLTGTEPFTSKIIISNINLYKEKLTWIKHVASNFANAKHRHMKYTEDIVVFGKSGSTFNRQMVPRKSERVRQAHKTGWERNATNTSIVSFSLKDPKPIPSTNWDADWKNPMDYIEIPRVVGNSKEKTKHPTQKPIKLLEYLIKTYSNEGETILDNTMGSGSTGVAAINLNRNFIGYELDDEYFEIAKERIEKALN